uniref:Uncharacterized protein n=1 Tax=Acrobeloides nanus TaxID=290746 RepID=A0A914CKI7_9BILA
MPEFREIRNWIERLVQRCVTLLQNRLNNGIQRNPNNLNNGLHQAYAPNQPDGYVPIQPVIPVAAVVQVPVQAAVQAPVQPVADVPFQAGQDEDMEVDQAPIQQVAAAAQQNKVTSLKRLHGKQASDDVIMPKKCRYDQF